jgi:hypothetical protein
MCCSRLGAASTLARSRMETDLTGPQGMVVVVTQEEATQEEGTTQVVLVEDQVVLVEDQAPTAQVLAIQALAATALMAQALAAMGRASRLRTPWRARAHSRLAAGVQLSPVPRRSPAPLVASKERAGERIVTFVTLWDGLFSSLSCSTTGPCGGCSSDAKAPMVTIVASEKVKYSNLIIPHPLTSSHRKNSISQNPISSCFREYLSSRPPRCIHHCSFTNTPSSLSTYNPFSVQPASGCVRTHSTAQQIGHYHKQSSGKQVPAVLQ